MWIACFYIVYNGIRTKCILFLDICGVACPVFCLKITGFVPNRIIQIDSFLQGLQSYKKSINGKYSIIFVTSIHRIAFRTCVSGAVIDRALVACGDF